MSEARPTDPRWVARLDAELPQTQCTRCGEPDCAAYAGAIAAGEPINRCPPGGEDGIRRLAALTGRPTLPLDPSRGQEGPRRLAWVDEAACIGCTLCIKACPVDCIVGAPKRMHTVVEALCTGCELCIPACPVDCIHVDIATPGLSGWAAWSEAQALEARARYERHRLRQRHDAPGRAPRRAGSASSSSDARPGAGTLPSHAEPGDASHKRAAIAAAVARARAKRGA